MSIKNIWVGWPQYPPSIAVNTLNKSTIVYASWNGSTETVAWQVLAGHSYNQMQVVNCHIPRKEFETKILVNSVGPYFQVKSLNESGQVLGISKIVHIKDADTL
ncbi:hypothetical protein [Gottfriedia acidiceleris]|uniref:hypothetical protein n=1 Tax=Gottfriedia acidiceleris TaxID=371036 RepID=UPI002FFFF704